VPQGGGAIAAAVLILFILFPKHFMFVLTRFICARPLQIILHLALQPDRLRPYSSSSSSFSSSFSFCSFCSTTTANSDHVAPSPRNASVDLEGVVQPPGGGR